jgi:hypothetical protein
MAISTTQPRRRALEPRVSRTYRLPLTKLKAAQRALGAATATETIERALDMVVFQRELIRGTRAMLGVTIESPDAAQ